MSTDAKAQRLLAAGRVHVRDASFAVVDGDTGRYRVAFEGDRWRCSCPAFAWRSSCPHTVAVVLVTAPPPPEWSPPMTRCRPRLADQPTPTGAAVITTLALIDSAVEAIDVVEHADHRHPASMLRAAGRVAVVAEAMHDAEFLDDREPIFCHLVADHWRLFALAQQRAVNPQHLQGVIDATTTRLRQWKRLLFDVRAEELARGREVERQAATPAPSVDTVRAEVAAGQAVLAEALERLDVEARTVLECPYCGVAPGTWCQRPANGMPMMRVHAARTGLLATARIACPHCSAPRGQQCDEVARTTHRRRREQVAMALMRRDVEDAPSTP